MTQRRTVVLFTLAFPYGTIEPFVETEAPVLARRFEKVIIVPGSSTTAVRPLPAGVELDSSVARDAGAGPAPGPAEAASSLVAPAAWREMTGGPPGRMHPRALGRLISWHVKAERVRAWIETAVRDGRIDPADTVLYSFWLDPAAVGIARSAARIPATLRVARAHRFDIYEDESTPAYLPFRVPTLAGLHAVYPDSQRGTDYLTERFPRWSDHIETRYLGTPDPERLTPPSSDGSVRIVSCSYLVPVKRVPLLARAIAVLADRAPERVIEWTHLGDGPQRAELEALCRDQLTAPNLRWTLAGQKSNREVLAWYGEHAVDAFVNVSASEGVPVSIMEAQAFGIPVVAPDAGGMREAVQPAHGSLLSADPSPEDVAAGVGRLVFADPGPRAGFRTASRAHWETMFSADVNYDRFVDRLAEVEEDAR